jgi:FAD/FMN-containing dehydrogenase
VDANLRKRWPKVDNYVFGHLGDGNLHLLVWTGEKGPENKKAVEEIVYAPLAAIGGSVSAEHGIGLHKKAYLALTRSEAEIALMRTLKRALDPKGILNPGKILDVA